MVSKHSHMPGAGSGRQQVNSLQASLSLVGSVLAAYHWSRKKMPISVCVMFAPLLKPQKKGMQFYSHPACIRRAQKDQTEQNRGLERIVSQTQRLLLGLDTVCLVTIYLCNHQAQRSLFIKGPTPGSFGMLNTSADLQGSSECSEDKRLDTIYSFADVGRVAVILNYFLSPCSALS